MRTKPIVLFSTRGGNTEKVAGEIAHELNCECIKVSRDFDPSALNLTDYDLVFLGTAIYGGRPNRHMLDYLKKMDLKKSIQFAIFITWSGAFKSDKKVFDKIKTVLVDKEQKVLDSYYKCYGEGRTGFEKGISSFFGADRRGHPDASDLSAAREWAKELTKTVQY